MAPVFCLRPKRAILQGRCLSLATFSLRKCCIRQAANRAVTKPEYRRRRQLQQHRPLLGGIRLHCIASIAYHSDIFISLLSPEKKRINYEKKKNKNRMDSMLLFVKAWMLPFPPRAKGERKARYERRSVSRKTDREGTGTNMLCFPWQRMEYFCSVAQQNRALKYYC